MIMQLQDIIDKLKADAGSDDIKILQREIIKVGGRKPGGKNLVVDGKYGERTEYAVNSVNALELLKGLRISLGDEYRFDYDRSGARINKIKHSSLKDVIMNYLASVEGDYIHKNATESEITAPYGIYKNAFPTADIFTFIDRIAKNNKLDVIKDMDKLNKIITNENYNEVRNLAWSFYVKEFLDVRLMNGLGPKSGLTVFSNSVNAGKSVGIKSLQYALGVKEDGIIGSITMTAINKYAKDDDKLNQKLLTYMDDFYHRLVEQNPTKYYVYLDGWMNRLNGLGYNG